METMHLEYGSKTYRTVKIGNQIWIAENLNYAGPNGDIGKYYEDDPANGEKYGRLYTWEEAMKICPPGWHLPSDVEWQELVDFVGSGKTAGKKFKSISGWNKNGNGTDDYGFSALPGGYGHSDGSFYDAGNSGNWWSTTEYGASHAWYLDMNYDIEYVGWEYDFKTYLLSVRCVRD